METNRGITKIIKYLLSYFVICVLVFLLSFFGNSLINGEATYEGLAKAGFELTQNRYAYSWARIVLLFILTLGFGKLLHKNDVSFSNFEKKLVSIITFVINIIFIICSIALRVPNVPWLERQFTLETVIGILVLFTNVIFIVLSNKGTINRLSDKRRIVFEYIFSFAVVFVFFILVRNNILYMIDYISHDSLIIFASNYMPQLDVLRVIFSVFLFGISGISLCFINKLLFDNYKIDNKDKKFIKRRVNTVLIILLLAFLIVSYGKEVSDCTYRFLNLRDNLIAYNERYLTSNEEQINAFCNDALKICLIQWGALIISCGISIGFIVSINKNINKIVESNT